MAKTMHVESGEPAFTDPRFVQALHGAYVIIANDSRQFLVRDLLSKAAVMEDENAKRIIGNFLVAFAAANKINLKQ